MRARAYSPLEFALLGLVRLRQPCSGYDLRKVFASTPMGTYSDSPGAIYPALARLEAQGLIRGRVEDTPAVRRRKLYRLTSKGSAALKGWLDTPVGRDDMVRGMSELALRFAFMDEVAGRDACIRFLESFARELASYIPVLREHLKSQSAAMSLSGRLALEGGIMGYESRLEWARMALETYRRT